MLHDSEVPPAAVHALTHASTFVQATSYKAAYAVSLALKPALFALRGAIAGVASNMQSVPSLPAAPAAEAPAAADSPP
jgi:hypothetical protein